MLIALAALFAAAADVPAGTAQAASPPAAAAPAAKPAAKTADADQIVCHTEQVTGSMFPHKVCRRKADADAARADEQRALRESQHAGGPPQH